MNDNLEKDLDRLMALRIEKLRAAKYSYDELLEVAATSWILADIRGNIPLKTEISLSLSDVVSKVIPRVVSKVIPETRSYSGKNAVSQRADQILKPEWIEHCKNAKISGVEINRLDDLFRIDGCSTDFKKHVDSRTLKRWAKEAGITLKAGRPKK